MQRLAGEGGGGGDKKGALWEMYKSDMAIWSCNSQISDQNWMEKNIVRWTEYL